MLEGNDREQTPLRWRLYGSTELDVAGDAIESEDNLSSVETEYVHPEALSAPPSVAGPLVAAEPPVTAEVSIVVPAPMPELPAPQPVVSAPAPTGNWKAELERAVAQTDERMARWISDQRRQLTEGLDLLMAQLEERRRTETAAIETWRSSERTRVEREFAGEEEQFRNKLMAELVAFEEQLGLRLREQEERLARWWDEAEELSRQRFAATREEAEKPQNA